MTRRPELRPHFDLFVALTPSDAMARLQQQFEAAKPEWLGHTAGYHGQLAAPNHRRHLWSPWLTFDAVERDGGTLLSGRFAPHPSVWTMYMAMYGMVIFSMFGLGCFGLSQLIAEEAPTMLWSLPIGAILLVALYASAFVGQGLTAEQMSDMRTFMMGAFDDGQARWHEDPAA